MIGKFFIIDKNRKEKIIEEDVLEKRYQDSLLGEETEEIYLRV